MCKYKVYPNEDIEIFTPHNTVLKECDNEIGRVFKKENGLYYINFKKILTDTNKELESVHSGNVNKIQLPCKLPYLTMFRVENIGENIE